MRVLLSETQALLPDLDTIENALRNVLVPTFNMWWDERVLNFYVIESITKRMCFFVLKIKDCLSRSY